MAGALIAGRPVLVIPAMLGAAAALAAVSGANALNDCFDIEADTVNRPMRPIPSGRVSVGEAAVVSGIAYALALALGALAGGWSFLMVAACVALTALYSASFKRVLVVGNLVAAVLTASIVVLGGVTQGKIGPLAIPFVMALVANVGREIVKDIEDVEGDARAGVVTLATRFGPERANTIARIVTVVLMGVVAAPCFARLYGLGYAVVAGAIELILVWQLVLPSRSPEPADLRLHAGALKLVMVMGLVAFLIGGVGA
jgi:geranylgeranylglycerol-phosphate geranylgeranyltransferase